jgi:hypothetical protein
MNTFLVTTDYRRHTNESSAVEDVFNQWEYRPLADERLTVLVMAEESLEDFVKTLRLNDVKCNVTELGKTVRVEGVA